jgi:mycothiol synthase
LTIRNFRWEDVPALAELENRLLQSPHASIAPKQRFVTEFLGQPNLKPEEDLFLHESQGSLRGFGLIFPEPAISRTVLMLKAHPNVDTPTVEEALLDAALSRAGQLGANVLQVQAKPDSPQSSLLLRRGFRHVRTYWTMGWEIQDLPPAGPPEGCTFRSYGREGDAEALTDIQNAAFGGSWGFAPNTPQEIAYRAKMSTTSNDGIIFLCQVETVYGYCWTYVMGDASKRVGIIFMIGIHPVYRRRRLGKPLLTAGLNFLASLGVDHVELEVDGANTPATRLYFSLGFTKVSESHWFEAAPGPA